MLRLRRLGIECGFVLVCAIWTTQSAGQAAENSVAAPVTTKAAENAQKAAQEAKVAADSAKRDAAKVADGGTALKGTTNVKDYINIQVVLLARKQAERVFSKEVANHYAVVQVIIDNKSEDAAFVLHSIFADYAGWR
jgi:hypothetical protein